MQLRIVCREGWTYASWQRVFFYTEDGTINVSEAVGRLLHATFKEQDNADALAGVVICGAGKEQCVFVLSGESFGIKDFADTLLSTLGGGHPRVVIADGDQKPYAYPELP
jgi:hypothetical protein